VGYCWAAGIDLENKELTNQAKTWRQSAEHWKYKQPKLSGSLCW